MKRTPSRTPVPALLTVVLLVAGVQAAFNSGTETEVEMADPPASGTFTVAIMADLTTGTEDGLDVLARAVDEINLLRPAFVLHIGDLLPGYIRDMGQWQRDADEVRAVLDGLDAPLYPVAGNHDVITGTDNPDDHRGEDLYRKNFGPLYYSFDYGGAHFVCLYTEETLRSRPRLSDRQLEWLRADLQAAGKRSTFVLMHKALWEYEGSRWDEAHELLKGRAVRAVFAGHFHHYSKSQERDGIQYYLLGVTGGRRFSVESAGGLEHYCLLSVGADDYRLALVRPGHVLADDYVAYDDFENMESIRFLKPESAGVAAPINSPELGPVDDHVSVLVTNPLDRPMRVVVRGVPGRGSWRFGTAAAAVLLGPKGRQTVRLPISSPQVTAEDLVPPQVEIQYDYEDAKGRVVPLVLQRRIPLRRTVKAMLRRSPVSVDGRATDGEWGAAPVLTTRVWNAGPYETGQGGPTFRIAPTAVGLYFHVVSVDDHVSTFRGERVLSDAVFIGAIEDPGKFTAEDMARLPVVVVFPFEEGAGPQALHAYWDARRPMGVPAEGVHVAARRLDGGWACEGFVPWSLLLQGGIPEAGDLYFNVGAWDNDGDLFTELHSWAPPDDATLWGRLELRTPQAD